MAALYFEDFEPGRVYDLGSHTVTEAEIVAFARAWDPQPFHVDPEAARSSPFGGLIASGWHTGSLMMRMLYDGLVKDTVSMGSPGVDELRWLKPVYPGDTLHVRGRIVEKTPSRSKPDIGSFRTETTITNQDGVPVMRFTSIVLIRRRPQ